MNSTSGIVEIAGYTIGATLLLGGGFAVYALLQGQGGELTTGEEIALGVGATLVIGGGAFYVWWTW